MPNNNYTVSAITEAPVLSHKKNVEIELISMLYQQVYVALIGVTTTATGIAAVFFNEVSRQVVVTWLVTVFTLTFIRYLSIRKFKSLDKKTVDIRRWGRLFAFFTFLSGLTWGAASIIFFTPDNLELFNILTLIVIAMSVGSLAALSAYPQAYYLFVIPTFLPIAWRYLSVDEAYYFIFGVLLFVLIFALFSIVRINNRMIHDAITLRFENLDLINQLTEQKGKAEQANKSKTRFLASASHDMRQPLHAMGLFIGVLEDRVDQAEHKSIIRKIRKSSDALGSLLDSLLDISKLDAGVIKVLPEPFFLNNLFKVLNNEFQAVAKEKNLKIKFVDTKLWVDSDYFIVERILRNLIANAIQYTEKGRILVGCRRHQGRILLAVYDTGMGIHGEEIPNIYREFHQLHNPERDRSKGLGLGLAIVERMAKLLGTPLYIESTPGKGSVFGITMQALPPPANVTSKRVAVPEAKFLDGKMVLVVDDEEEVRESLTVLLQNWRCDVVVASSATEAIGILQKNNFRPDILLVDYRLRNNETGTMVIDKINALYEGQDIPAVIITGDTAPDRIREVELSGHNILHKPVPPDVLRLLLAEIL